MGRPLAREIEMKGKPLVSAKGRKQATGHFCLDCSYVGSPKKYRPGAFRMEVWLWALILIPGIMNLLWRLSAIVPVVDDFVRMLAGQLPSVVRFLTALLSPYRVRPYGPEIEYWVFFLIPGVFYSCWRLLARYEGCAKCGSFRIVSMDSPQAQDYLATLTPSGSSQPWVCGKCASQVFAGGRVCPTCGAEIKTQQSKAPNS